MTEADKKNRFVGMCFLRTVLITATVALFAPGYWALIACILSILFAHRYAHGSWAVIKVYYMLKTWWLQRKLRICDDEIKGLLLKARLRRQKLEEMGFKV